MANAGNAGLTFWYCYTIIVLASFYHYYITLFPTHLNPPGSLPLFCLLSMFGHRSVQIRFNRGQGSEHQYRERSSLGPAARDAG